MRIKILRCKRQSCKVVAQRMIVSASFCSLLFFPSLLLADTGPHEGGAGCVSGEEQVACSTSYGKGCERYRNSPNYYIGRWEGHGVQTDYTFCKGSKQPESTSDAWLPLKVAGLALLALGSFLLLKKVHQKK